jgi:hypothetical protein
MKTEARGHLLSQVPHEIIGVTEQTSKQLMGGRTFFWLVTSSSAGIECRVEKSPMLAPMVRLRQV